MDFPAYLLQYDQRSQPRMSIPPQMRTKCTVECPGVIAFEMDVADISRGGMGLVIHDPGINLLSFIFSAGIGVVFGYFPARRAAQLDPIEALRHE